jgi:hypothetical protein
MKAGLVVLGLFVLVLTIPLAALGAKTPKPPAPGAKKSAAEKKAVELAQAFLAKKKVKWGKPEKVTPAPKGVGDGKDTFVVTYPTPAKEVTLLGHRAVIVNIATKKVTFVPRE